MDTPRKGCEQPRIFTPPLRELTRQTTHGFSVIDFAERTLGIALLPWQKWLFIHALELREDGLYRFRTVLVLIARQNGKTLCMLILALWHIYVRGSRTVIGTAQDLANAEKAWGEAVEIAEAVPDLAAGIRHVVKVNGKKALKLHAGEQYRVAAASRRGARGFSGDLVLLDELREHQSWDAWGASTKTTLARPHAQVWGFSNAGDSLSVVLRYLRALAHHALGWPDGDADAAALELIGEEVIDEADEDDSLALFEWSAPPTADRRDRDAWAQANPSLGWTITERAIAAALRTDPPAVFSVEVLCRWLESANAGPFGDGVWAASLDATSRIGETSRRVVAVDVSWNRSSTYIALAGFRTDGLAHVEITADRAGTDWVIDWLLERRDRIDAVVLQANGAPVSSLLDALTAADLPVLAWAGPDLGRATGQAFDLVDNKRLRHLPHPGLDLAATTAAVRPAGDAWVIDRKRSPSDAAPLVAAIAALWALLAPDDPAPQIHTWPDELWEETTV
ncbi:terminase large subunit domain-containing protein [Nocardia altamirensis]|uniref:terminase large subunit domain-containing protein n=1 Tax=Nocardia altamirensis TaxID=472158 RepID=UPI0008403066|nr:terminase family protein [Nocardia altamirensis]